MLMSVNQSMATLSGDFLIAALMIYSASVIAFAGDFAFGRPRRAAAAKVVAAADATAKERELATVGGAAVAAVAAPGASAPAGAMRAGPGPAEPAAEPPGTASRQGPLAAIGAAGGWVRAGVVLSALGAAAHLVAVVARGLAVHRAPWGNMYEFVTALTCVAAIFFLFAMIRYRAWTLGVFVMGAVVVTLGLAETLVYTAPGDLVPALQSYWLDIHVTAMTLATGIFFVSAVLGFVYLWVDRYTRRVAAGRGPPGKRRARRLPPPEPTHPPPHPPH